MKKILIIIVGILFFTGCTDMMNTPTKRVEEFLGKYQTMDAEVLKQLDDVIEEEESMTEEQRKEYQDLMKKQYQNLTYKIKDETVNGDTATVEVEIEVFDYQKAIDESEKYLNDNKEEFLVIDEKSNDKKTITSDIIDQEKYMDYKIKQLKDVKDKVKYTLTMTLTKKENKWVLDDVSEVDRLKIHGLYNY